VSHVGRMYDDVDYAGFGSLVKIVHPTPLAVKARQGATGGYPAAHKERRRHRPPINRSHVVRRSWPVPESQDRQLFPRPDCPPSILRPVASRGLD